MIILYVPCRNSGSAKALAGKLIAERLIACANIIPIKSIFRWKGKLCRETESVMLAKTSSDKEIKARKRIGELHEYDVPAIISWKAKANKQYEKWLMGELQ